MADGLRSALAEQQAAEEQRRFLISAVAHDLRTPLFTLRDSLEAIEHGIGGPEQLRRAQDKATLLDHLVGDLFTFTHLEYAGPQLDVEELDAVALAHEAADTVDLRIAVTAPDRPVPLDGDPVALLRVLINLLDNAVRDAQSSVELVVRAEDDEVVFAVLDDVLGLAQEDLAHLFEPPFRADRARNSATGGAGLGLAIVQRLAGQLLRRMPAEAVGDPNTRFAVVIPIGAEAAALRVPKRVRDVLRIDVYAASDDGQVERLAD